MATSESANQLREPTLSPLVACTLSGADLAARVERWERLLRVSGLGRIETEDGLRLSFRDQPAVEEELRTLVAAESECCAWAHWEVRREDAGLALHARSTKEGVATLQRMFRRGRSG